MASTLVEVVRSLPAGEVHPAAAVPGLEAGQLVDLGFITLSMSEGEKMASLTPGLLGDAREVVDDEAVSACRPRPCSRGRWPGQPVFAIYQVGYADLLHRHIQAQVRSMSERASRERVGPSCRSELGAFPLLSRVTLLDQALARRCEFGFDQGRRRELEASGVST